MTILGRNIIWVDIDIQDRIWDFASVSCCCVVDTHILQVSGCLNSI